MNIKMTNVIIRKTCGILLSASLVLSAAIVSDSTAWAASRPKDIKNHWAQKSIEKVIDAGIVSGYKDGNFRPDSPVTRAEFCHMVNETLGNTGTVSLNFKDVPRNEWYYSDISKGLAAGYVSGYANNTFKPDQRISRQEAAVILSRVVPISGSSASLSKYPDYKNIETWARPAMEYIVGKGYIGTYSDGKIYPQDKMTRAQAATIISNVLSKETIVKTDPGITKDGTKLSNTIYSNSVTISKSLGDGDATLTNCVVLGTLNVLGGDAITLNGCRVSNSSVQKVSGTSHLLVKGDTSVKNTSAAYTSTLETSGLSGSDTYAAGFENIDVQRDAKTTLRGTFPVVNMSGSSSDVTLTSGKITTLNVSSSAKDADITVDSGASIALANVAAQSYFHGTGTVTKMAANANNITYERKPGTITVGSGVTKSPTLVDAGLSISPNPSNGKTGVKANTDITLTFNSAVKLYDGSSIAKSDILNFVELRLKSSSGSKEKFSATIDSAKKVITITPDSDLDTDTKYYISIAKNKLKDSEGNANAAFSSYFTVGDESSDYVTFTPKNRATGVSLSNDLTVRFSEKMVNYDGSTIGSSDLSDIVTFRRGSSSSGSKVSVSMSIDSGKKIITIDPTSKLEEDTTYYLAVNSRSVKTSSGSNVVPSQSITFKTSGSDDSDYCTFTPKNKASGVSLSDNLTVRFSEKMVNYDGSSIGSSDLSDIITFRRGTSSSGSKVPASISIDSGKKIITIDPTSKLEEDTAYYLAVNSKSVKTSSGGDAVPGQSITFQTMSSRPVVTLTTSANADTITVSASGTVAGKIYAVLLPAGSSLPTDTYVIDGKDASGKPALSRISAEVTANSPKALGTFTTLTPLTPKTTYRVWAVLVPNSSSYSNSIVVSKDVTTADRPSSVLDSLSVSYDGKEYPISLNSSMHEYKVEVPFGTTQVTVAASTSGGNTKIHTSQLVTGVAREPLSVKGGENSFDIVSNKSGLYETTYTLTIQVKGNTDLESVTADGEDLHPKGTAYEYEIPADKNSVDIIIKSADSGATIFSGSTREGSLTLVGIDKAQTIEFTVKSNGDEKGYSIKITKAEAPLKPESGDSENTSPTGYNPSGQPCRS